MRFAELHHGVEIKRLLDDVEAPVCVEIGGGLGGQTYQTVTMCGDKLGRYLLFDIPEVAANLSQSAIVASYARRESCAPKK